MIPPIEQMKSVYDKHLHLKNAADELGMKWQTLYWHLQKAGHPVTGNKARYGSETDKLASKAESDFMNLVPAAIDMNRKKFQSKYDFEIYGMKVDVKASSQKEYCKNQDLRRYSFSVKKQEMLADFIVAFGYNNGELEKCYLFPKEHIRFMTTISISNGKSKWQDFEIAPEELKPFFDNYRQ